MDFASFWSAMGLGIEADLEKRTFTIKVGPVVIKGLKLPAIRVMAENRGEIEQILSTMFIQQAIMWVDFRREPVVESIKALNKLKGDCEVKVAASTVVQVEKKQMATTLLLAWANECDEAARLLRHALQDEAAGMNVVAHRAIPEALGTMRKRVYPFIELLIDLLPDASLVKVQGARRLLEGRNVLVRHYNVSMAEMPRASLEAETV
jgi:hypothetical protein